MATATATEATEATGLTGEARRDGLVAEPTAGLVRRSPVEARRDELVEELVELRSVINAAEARCAAITNELAALEDGHPLGCTSTVQFLSWQAGLSSVAAKALITVGERLEELPSLRQAASAGEVSVWQAKAIASAAVDDDEAAGLVDIARHATCAQLETACRHLVRSRAAGDDAEAAAHRARRLRTWWSAHGLRIDGALGVEAGAILSSALERAAQQVPDDTVGDADDSQAAHRADALEMLARAFLDTGDEPSSSGSPPGHLSIHIGLDRLLEHMGQHVDSDAEPGAGPATDSEWATGCDTPTRPEANRGSSADSEPDAESAPDFGCATDRSPKSSPARPTPVSAVELTEAAVGLVLPGYRAEQPAVGSESDPADGPTALDRELSELCRLGWHGPGVADTLVRRLCCDATIQAVIADPDGNPLALGHRYRVVNRPLRRALYRRDGGRCQAPGCDARRFLHAHHIVAWAQGGPTELANLVLLCSWHHRMVHHGLLEVTVTDGRPEVTHTRPLRRWRPPLVANIGDAAVANGVQPRPDAARSRWEGDHIDYACFDAAYLH